jgi:hypothetical protein
MAQEEEMKKTSSVQRPTPNPECRGSEFLLIGCSAFNASPAQTVWRSLQQ